MFEFCKRFATNFPIDKRRLILVPIICCTAVVGTVSNAFAAPIVVVQSTVDLSSTDESPAESLDESTSKSLFISSGLQALLQLIPSSTARSFEAALTGNQLPSIFADVDKESIRLAVNNAFKTETFDKYLIKELHNGMSLEGRNEMLAWYASSLGKRVKQAELENSLLTQQARFMDYQNFLSAYPVNAKREQLILNLDYTMKSTESAVDMMSNIQMAFNLSLSRFMPEEQRLSREEILALAHQNNERLLEQYERQTQDVLLFTYQDLNDEELAQLDEVLATEAGQKFVLAINNGIKKAMFAASLDLGEGLGSLLNKYPRGPGI